jgi:hypothetical protein
MEQSHSWVASSVSFTQLLRNFSPLMATKRLLPCSQEPAAGQLVPILSQMILIRIFEPYFRKIKFNIIRHYIPTPISLFSSDFPTQILYAFLISRRRTTCPANYRFDFISLIIFTADHSGRAVWGMNCLRSFERWDLGFESRSRHGCLYYVQLFCVCVVLCVSRGLATGWFPVQGVLPTVYKIKKLKKRPRPNKGL